MRGRTKSWSPPMTNPLGTRRDTHWNFLQSCMDYNTYKKDMD